MRLAAEVAGEGPAALLVHGFPDSRRVWRHQIGPLGEAGFRVIAPDLRGFGESERPEGVEAYRVTLLVDDLLELLDEHGVERAHVVGHDWGAGIAWVLAGRHPDRVLSLAALSVGHPNASRPRSLESREKGWYQLLFQFEDVAEELLVRDDWRLFREWTRGDGDVERAIAGLSRPGALTAALNWYRASAAPASELRERPPFPSVAADTLGLWSDRDHYLVEAGMTGSGEYVVGEWRYERIEGASHWMQLDAPERVNALLLDWFG